MMMPLNPPAKPGCLVGPWARELTWSAGATWRRRRRMEQLQCPRGDRDARSDVVCMHACRAGRVGQSGRAESYRICGERHACRRTKVLFHFCGAVGGLDIIKQEERGEVFLPSEPAIENDQKQVTTIHTNIPYTGTCVQMDSPHKNSKCTTPINVWRGKLFIGVTLILIIQIRSVITSHQSHVRPLSPGSGGGISRAGKCTRLKIWRKRHTVIK